MLISAPTGISWKTIPGPQASAAAQLAEQFNMCLRATHAVEAYCNQTLRATIDLQTESGPSRRLTVDGNTGVARLTTNNWPVLAVVSAQVGYAGSFPRVWAPLDSNQYDVDEAPPVNTGSAVPAGSAQGSNAILLAPGMVNWSAGRRSMRVSVQYLNGWPHCGLMTGYAAGVNALHVDDVTGFGLGQIQPGIYEGAFSEIVTVTSCTADNGSVGLAMNGPGTLHLAAATQFAHAGPVDGIATALVTTMPLVVQRATILLAVHEALVRGSSATTVPRQPGIVIHGGGSDLDLNAFELLLPFRRVI